ncbi:MAG: nicotinate (nicotinamide) nucleotide adenylyltransferase [Actinomycetota bacterium]
MIATKSIALFGGSFDPIHNGHLFVIEELLSSARFEKFIVIPAGNPWQKSVAASAAHRLAMVEIALKDCMSKYRELEISRFEFDDSRPSYAFQSIDYFTIQNPGDNLVWIIGSDAFAKIGEWKEIELVAKSVEFLVITRPGQKFETAKVAKSITYSQIEIKALDISSTKVRNLIEASEPYESLLPAGVADYIKSQGIYAAA